MSKIAFIYPGQGAQKAGMGADFYERSETARAIFDQAGEKLGLDMKALCFEENEKLDLTEYTQAALVTTCLAMTRVVRERGLKPDITAGLSLGEYSAIAAAGGMDDLDAVRLVRKRGILMQNTVPAGEGGMCAVMGMEASKIEEVLEEMDGEEAGNLNVSGPFHSPLLVPAGEELAKELETVTLHPLDIPYVTNVTAEKVEDIGVTRELLTKQVSSPVRWMQSMEAMIREGVDIFVEIGPGKTLAGFMKKISRDVKVYNIAVWEDVEKVAQELQ